jgi:hypothetical protein
VALGLACLVLGPVGYFVQIKAERLFTPWYLPGLATFGAVLIIAALVQKCSIWRVLALLVAVLLAGAEWMFLLVAVRLPPYTGPVAVGQSFPSFSTLRADNSPFTQRDLEGGPNHVLVFFRGRW